VGCVILSQIPRAAPDPRRRSLQQLCLAAFLCKFLFPIQASILNRFADMARGQLRHAGKVGDGSRDLQYAMVGPRRESETRHRLTKYRLDRLTQPTVTSQVSGAHVSIGVHAPLLPEASSLDCSSVLDTAPDSGAGFSALRAGQIPVGYRRYLEMNIDPIEQWAGNSGSVAFDG